MKLILADDNKIELNLLERECRALPTAQIAGSFTAAEEAIDFVRRNPDVELALLDIEMPGMNGMELADALREIRRDILIVFVTAHSERAADALRRKADYIVFKPFDSEDIRDAMERASLMQQRQNKPIYATMFGPFDVMYHGRIIRFRTAKAKELMALLLCRRGTNLSIHDMVDCLWDGDDMADVQSVGYRQVIKDLTDTLGEYGISDILERGRGYVRLDTSNIDADYYRFLRGIPEDVIRFQGRFLDAYSWSEGYIYRMIETKEIWMANRKENGQGQG